MSVSAMRGTCGSETTLSVSESATAQDSVINAYEKDCITLFILPSQGSWHPPGKSVIGMSLSLTAKFRRRMLLHLRPFPCFPSLRLRERERQNKASYFHHLDRPTDATHYFCSSLAAHAAGIGAPAIFHGFFRRNGQPRSPRTVRRCPISPITICNHPLDRSNNATENPCNYFWITKSLQQIRALKSPIRLLAFEMCLTYESSL